MLAFNRVSVILCLAIGAAGCASNNIRSDFDRNVDWSQFETYNFFPDAGPDGNQYRSLFTTYMIDAITQEMESRGYTKSDNPDLLVNFNARLEDRTQVSTSPGPSVGVYYGYRRGYYSPWIGYGYATETTVSQYTQGTFNIDVVDAQRKQLIWEAVGVGRITQRDYEQMEQRVREGVPRYFESFPARAGQAAAAMPQN